MRLLLVTMLIAMPFAAYADESTIHVDHVRSRAAMVGQVGVVYLTITDTGAKDTLMGVTTPVADKAELHQSFDDHGVMKMRSVPTLPIEPGKPVTLAPGSYHIMLMGLKQALKKGDGFPLTLSFEKAKPVTVQVEVGAAGSTAPMPSMHGSQPVRGSKP